MAVLKLSTARSVPSPSPDDLCYSRSPKVALTNHGIGFAKRVAEEHVFVASGGGNVVSSLAPPVGKLRDDDRADGSPNQDAAPMDSLQLLDQALF